MIHDLITTLKSHLLIVWALREHGGDNSPLKCTTLVATLDNGTCDSSGRHRAVELIHPPKNRWNGTVEIRRLAVRDYIPTVTSIRAW